MASFRRPAEYPNALNLLMIAHSLAMGGRPADLQPDLGNANVTSLIERKTRYTVMIKNNNRHSRPIMGKIVDTFAPLPAFARQSFTFDRGTEFTAFRLWKMVLPHAVGSATPVRPGRKLQRKTLTSAFAALCQAIRILQPYRSAT